MTIVALACLSAFMSADRFAAFHLGLSRPIVISIIVGLLFGTVQETILVGLIFELLGVVDVPVGTRIPKDDTFGSYAAAVMISIHEVQNLSEYAFIILIILMVMVPVTFSCQIGRKFNKRNYINQLNKHRLVPEKLIALGFLFAMVRGLIVYNIGFGLVHLIYTIIEDYAQAISGKDAYLVMLIVFLSGYLIRFLSAKSFLKYALFIAGFLIGWVAL